MMFRALKISFEPRIIIFMKILITNTVQSTSTVLYKYSPSTLTKIWFTKRPPRRIILKNIF